MKASFVIPVMNGSAYIAETLDSCVSQTLRDIEVIVVDDGSTDRTRDIVNYFMEKDKRIRLIAHDSNKGRSTARNTGIADAQSEVILISDADDISHRSRAGDTVKFFKVNPGLDIVTTKAQAIDALGNVIGLLPTRPFSYETVKAEKQTYIVHSTMGVRKDVFSKVLYSEGDFSKHGIDDWKFQVDCHKAGLAFGYIKKALVQYRFIPKPRDEKAIMELKESCLR